MIFISFTGDFDSNILPLFAHHAHEIRMHILLHDKRNRDNKHAKHLNLGLERYCQHLKHTPVLLEMAFDEDSIESIHEIYDRITSLQNDDELLYFNLSDGLASTSAVLHPLIMSSKGVILAYDRFENTCNYVSPDGMVKKTIAGLGIKEHLMLKNIDYTYIKEDDAMHARKAQVFALMQKSDEYLVFRDHFLHSREIPPHLDWMTPHATKLLEQTDRKFLEGNIFEEYCYWLVKELDFDDVMLGIKTTLFPDTSNDFINEFDVLMMKDNHLHVMECKLRRFIDGEHFIYKYDSVSNLLDFDGRSMIVSVGGKPYRESKKGVRTHQFNEGNRKRALRAQIAIYQEERMDAETFQKQVKGFFL